MILYTEDELFQRGLILTDDIASDPILDFNLYSNAIVEIVRNSHPKFTIGVFGDWGAGKSTLINSVDKALQTDKDLIRIKLEAWRYKREQFPLVSLLIELFVPGYSKLLSQNMMSDCLLSVYFSLYFF